ncbi:MAG TPA: PIG-L family deacetylase [Bryobacteraceae bacterium]|jgi:LmbE family N-acetylglucosaminyl deacetylase|nr:PIG-L family deacetylase [Bryobacteraceae bacterium]
MKNAIRKSHAFLASGILFALVSGIAVNQLAADADALAIAPDRGAAGLARLLREIRTRASLALVVAHPDDEDGGMLVQETRGEGARAVQLTLNRGEGGQNEMGGDTYDAMGLVRTQELLQADRYYGVEQYWTRTIDYGFSKTREEALEKWGHDRVLADVVRVIRMTRPLVVMSVFTGNATDGHGNHQVAGQMAQEAWVAAGDPAKFPEQLREGLRPWSPLKVYARSPNFEITKDGMYDYAIDKFVPVRFFDYVAQQWTTEKPPVNVTIDESKIIPGTGLTATQIAREGWGLQKSQNGGGTLPVPAPSSATYHRYGSRVKTTDREKTFFDGIDVSLSGIATLATGDTQFLKTGLAAISARADEAFTQYSIEKPGAIAPLLADGLKATRDLSTQVRSSRLAEPGRSDVLFELGLKEKQFQQALAASLELSFQTAVSSQVKMPEPGGGGGRGRGGAGMMRNAAFTMAIPGQAFAVETTSANLGTESVTLDGVTLAPSDGKNWNMEPQGNPSHDLAPGKNTLWRMAVKTPEDAAITRPYYKRDSLEQPYYDLLDPRYLNLPTAPYPLTAHARFVYRGIPFEMEQVVQTSERVAGTGQVLQPLMVAPAISVGLGLPGGALPLTAKSLSLTATVHSNVKGPAQGTLRLTLPAGWRSEPAEAPFSMARDGEDRVIAFDVIPSNVKAQTYTISATAEYQGHQYSEGYQMAGYPGVRNYPFYTAATYRATGVDIKTVSGLRLGYLPGTGDEVPRAIENLGYEVRVLATSDLTQGDLSGYDAIVLGVRAYAVRNDLKSANARLLDYVKNGGVLIVQYNLQDFDHNYGPYPFELGSNPQKVVDEASAVKFLEPDNPLFGWPNKILPEDFKGWEEERGHGFMKSWDPRYTALVETHDPEQDEQKGGLLVARYGKGFYIYDAFAIYRQLPSGVPGAYRLLGNMISLRKNPAYN